MRTFNGQTISKKYIASVLRTMDSTQIYRLVHIIYGGTPSRLQVCQFIHEYAPSQRVDRNAYRIAYPIKQSDAWEEARKAIAFQQANQKHIAIECLRENIARGLDSYTKRPIMGNTHLYFASPVYQHADYNKWKSVEIKGNEKFCEIICQLADKYFPIAKL